MPAQVRPLIERCLAKDPDERPTTADLLAELGSEVGVVSADWLPEPLTATMIKYVPTSRTPADPAAGGDRSRSTRQRRRCTERAGGAGTPEPPAEPESVAPEPAPASASASAPETAVTLAGRRAGGRGGSRGRGAARPLPE